MRRSESNQDHKRHKKHKKEKEKEKERQRDRDRDQNRDREKERQKQRQQRDKQKQRNRQKDRQKQRYRDRQRQREKERYKDKYREKSIQKERETYQDSKQAIPKEKDLGKNIKSMKKISQSISQDNSSNDENISKRKDKKKHRQSSRQKGKQRKRKERSRSKSKKKRSRQRQRSRSRKKSRQRVKSPDQNKQTNRKNQTEEQRLRKLQKRLVKARIMRLDDLLSDQQEEKQKKPSKWEVPTLPNSAIEKEPVTNHNEDKSLSLDHVGASDDYQFKITQDKSIDIQHQKKIGQKHENNNQEQEDPLQAFMKQISGNAVKQMQLPKKGQQNIITFEDILNERHNQQAESDDQQKFKSQFMQAIKNVKKQTKVDERGQVMDNDDNRSDAQDFLIQEKQDLDFFEKQKKLAERKELNQVDHQKNVYQDVKFNFYRQAQQIRNLPLAEVQRYRKQAGDIKVRGRDILNPVFNWYQCGFSEKVLTVIQKRNYKKPFPIQAQSFPIIMSGRDMIGIAETGSGKTLAYLLPAIRHVQDQKPVEQGEGPIVIIMIPTRQLARQVHAQCKAFCKPMGIRCLPVYGGLGVQGQLSDLRKGAEIVVCTPGRMIDVLTLNNGKITNLRRVTMIVIDEADRMFDLGFQPQITKIMNNVRPMRQTVMFSATFPKNVENLAKRILRRPIQVIVGSRGQACTNIQQIIQVRQETSKFLRLLEILGNWNNKGSILIFVDKQSQADLLFKQLLQYGYHSLVLHGAMDHTDRQFTIYDFKKGVVNIMIATSVCARGLDIKSIVLVVNFKCPNHLQDYVHRIGRTGRAGNKGTAITFITPSQQQYSIDLIKALEMADVEPPQQLKKMVQNYLSKVNKGQARKIRNRNIQGTGFKFDQQQQDKAKQLKDMIKKQMKNQGLGGFSDSDQDDLEKQKKRQQDRRGRNDQERVAQAIKDPEIKQKLLAEAMKAVSQAIKNGVPMTTQKLLQIAINQMKQAVGKHKVIRTVNDGVQQVTKLINQFENKNPDGQTEFFSYDFQINDYPPAARQKACNQQFMNSIQHLTNCNISLRGSFVEPGKKLPVGSRKLYLHIQGENKYYVSSAYKQIKRVLQECAFENIQIGTAIGKYSI